MASNFPVGDAWKYFIMWTSGKRNVLALSKIYSNKIVSLINFKWSLIAQGFSVVVFYPSWLYPKSKQ